MRRLLEVCCIALSLAAAGGWGQRVQNMDIYYLAGPARVDAQTIAGSSVTLSGSSGYSLVLGYGYMVKRMSAASVWIEFAPFTNFQPGTSRASIAGSTTFRMTAMTPGARVMLPVHSRVSLYGALGGGVGWFRNASVSGSANPFITTVSATHGVFSMGAGLDFRLIQRLSLRGEIRDFITGRNLGGVSGTHHAVPVGGLALHF